VLPRWVRSLDDYWSWFAEQLDYSGGRLEDDSVQVQVVEDEATGERLALILGRQRVIFHGGSWLEFRVVVDGHSSRSSTTTTSARRRAN
jgi:hypothetical protein